MRRMIGRMLFDTRLFSLVDRRSAFRFCIPAF
jgi:hypothetical protein